MALIFLGLIVFVVSYFLNKQREEFQKLAKFQESAKTQGYSDVQINEFLEKRAMELPVSISIETLNSIARNAKG